MKKSLVVFLQSVVILIAIAVFAFMLWEPQVEGRNAHSNALEIYFNDPFLAYAYTGSIPFFVLVYQTFKVFGYMGQNRFVSQATLKALRTIKYCALAVVGFVAVGEIFIMLGESDDRAGGVFMGILFTFISLVIAATAARFESIVQKRI
ncbi:MAG: DUF2975 domain-containing protein [Candidatus Doudnabacteria bacterium]|nr:DUF2975 domain-containing protein [Candidatus Doudnabacteria bacterium]